MPESVVRDVSSGRYGAQLLGPCGRLLYPPVRRRPRCADERIALTDVAKLQGAGEGRVQLGMGRHVPGPASLAPSNPDGGAVGVQREVPRLDRERLGVPEPCPSFNQEQQHEQGGESSDYSHINHLNARIHLRPNQVPTVSARRPSDSLSRACMSAMISDSGRIGSGL